MFKGFHGSVEAFDVKAVDTTGAGDSFIGAFLSQIVDDQTVLEVEHNPKPQNDHVCNKCDVLNIFFFY